MCLLEDEIEFASLEDVVLQALLELFHPLLIVFLFSIRHVKFGDDHWHRDILHSLIPRANIDVANYKILPLIVINLDALRSFMNEADVNPKNID